MKESPSRSQSAILWRLAKNELLARRLSSALSLAAIAFAATLALTITLYLTGTQIQQEKILGNMQHVMYMDILPEQLQAIGADERVEMCVPYKPLDTEFEMDGVKFSLVYYESVPAGIQTYTVSEGRPPEAYNEIVVDKSFMDALGQESVLGKELTLDLNGRNETFLISGYTDDAYSMLTHPVRVSQSFADQSPEMSSVPYTALVRLRDASEMPSATFSTTVYQIALDYGVARANVNINGTFETSLQSGNTALYVIVLLAIMIAVACGIVIYSTAAGAVSNHRNDEEANAWTDPTGRLFTYSFGAACQLSSKRRYCMVDFARWMEHDELSFPMWDYRCLCHRCCANFCRKACCCGS